MRVHLEQHASSRSRVGGGELRYAEPAINWSLTSIFTDRNYLINCALVGISWS